MQILIVLHGRRNRCTFPTAAFFIETRRASPLAIATSDLSSSHTSLPYVFITRTISSPYPILLACASERPVISCLRA